MINSPKIITVTYNEKQYKWDGRTWYGANDNMLPGTAIIQTLNKKLQELQTTMIFIDEDDNNPDSCTYLVKYHPYRGGRNPAFDNWSSEILHLKDRHAPAIEKFYLKLDPLLAKGFPIAVVPSSDPAKANSGITLLAKKLAANDRIDATSCLKRHKKVPKKTLGGSRNMEIDLNSIEVVNENLIRDKDVMLLDDVRTTGGSLDACSQLLKDAGARTVKKVALAQTVSY